MMPHYASARENPIICITLSPLHIFTLHPSMPLHAHHLIFVSQFLSLTALPDTDVTSMTAGPCVYLFSFIHIMD